MMVRQTIALLLMTCFGIMIPTAASAMRVCRLESTAYVGGFKSYGVSTDSKGDEKAKCCPDCGEESQEDDPCCVDLKKLPDAPAPAAPIGLPPFLPVEIRDYAVSIERLESFSPEVYSAAEPIRGPTQRFVRRALLGIWNI
jgi:hypothetical protein